MNVAPAAAGNMQELRGKVPKGITFINNWLDAAELCPGGGKCQQQLSARGFCIWRGLISPVTALRLEVEREALYIKGFVHFSHRKFDFIYARSSAPMALVL